MLGLRPCALGVVTSALVVLLQASLVQTAPAAITTFTLLSQLQQIESQGQVKYELVFKAGDVMLPPFQRLQLPFTTQAEFEMWRMQMLQWNLMKILLLLDIGILLCLYLLARDG